MVIVSGMSNTHPIIIKYAPFSTITTAFWSPITILEDSDTFSSEMPLLMQQKVMQGMEEGYECITCRDFYPFAALNYPENSQTHFQFRCYCCRKGLRNFF